MPNKDRIVRENESRRSFLYLILLLLFAAIYPVFSTSIQGQIAIPLPEIFSDIKGKITEIEALDDLLFVGTTEGLWIISEDGKLSRQQNISGFTRLRKISDQIYVVDQTGLWYISENRSPLKVEEVSEIINERVLGDKLFVGTNKGSWIVDKNIRISYKEIHGRINHIKTFGAKIFVNTENGSWIIDRNNQLTQINKIQGEIDSIHSFGEKLLIRTRRDSWIIDKDNNLAPANEIVKNAEMIIPFGELLFIDEDESPSILDKEGNLIPLKDKLSSPEGLNAPVGNSSVFDDNLFINIGKRSWIIDKNSNPHMVEGLEGQVNFNLTIDHKLFVATDNALWVIEQNSLPTLINEIKGSVKGIKKFDERFFINTDKGSWILNKDGILSRIEQITDRLTTLTSFGEELLIVGTFNNLWIINQKGQNPKKIESINGNVESIDIVGKYIYVKISAPSPEVFYRIDPEVTITSELLPIETEISASSLWARLITGLRSNWLPVGKISAQAFYVKENIKAPYGKDFPKEFSFAKDKENNFDSQENFRYEINWGENEVHYWIKDKWGNTSEHRKIYYGFPTVYFFTLFLAALSFILWVILISGCLALAPRIGFCHSAIMNPWLRKYFSLGSVPLLLSVFPSLRRYILRRYSDSINKDKEFIEWKERFVCPDEEFLPENFGKRLENERRLLLTGQSGIGKTSFFKYLTAIYASPDKPPLLAKVFPVYIPMTNYGGISLEDLVYNQLFAYGEISDEELAPMFWKRGGLLIFFDGVNEVQNVSDRQKLSEFVEKYWTSNYICLSSQQTYPEIENIPEVKLKTFSPEKVCELIRQRVNDKGKAEKLIAGLTDEDYQLYSIPRDLEFAVEILNGGKDSLPKSRTELYKTVFSSLFAKWKENGDADAEINLCQQAYEKLVGRDAVFDSVDNPKLKEITLDLYKQKFLMKREKNYYFRHDLIRSFLASEYFYPRWQRLFANLNGTQIDNNWQDMLRFSCENIENPNDVKALVYEVLERGVRRDVAEDLFEWLKIYHPSKCEPWEENFYIRAGKIKYGKQTSNKLEVKKY